MIYTQEVENMCPVAQGVHHGAAPVPTEGKWVQNKKVEDISGFTHGVGWCAPQQYDTFSSYGSRDFTRTYSYGSS